ncbi:hypothetical protein CDL15_Pgr013055 [Punica granatum]|uniref:Bifunctional fatty acid conjugase/Delta(12)-oleate desaturase n=3 Tax=Punica granatum TaxID=22663 RepID=FADX_PUNGR|nr:bifunctional fatty acid conjugase/Delta(12)-oleate desaturase [Punica granatum]Q84UB8.1 RecName: Full=Bifunctional fatty acid conjugase/Delta(12)-oleate desaturase; Short=PgFAC; AltName: Full=Delta(12)-acyl-lipid-conjugase FADX; AltName: Full=Delta(12)-linoleic acid (1,4)-acyl-lipid-desaturase; AltName: Full=Delta(12)-oleate desaturase; AltName: Full=Fatty acid conjugase; AltName: Full=Linoleoyl-lipid Delta(12) conjugase (11E,13Z-forming) [Punica granatum]AVV48224.1 fatty acid conjugase [synth
MGADGTMSPVLTKRRPDQEINKLDIKPNHEVDIARRAPHSKPPFTLSDLRSAIPPHCFHRSLLMSSSYLIRDFALAFLFYHSAVTYIPLLPKPLACMAWPVYWFLQGSNMLGIWVIAHECGHQAFSNYGWVNDAVGFFLHTSLLVPYFPFKYSHRRHHSNTNSVEHDEVFVPRHKDGVQWYYRFFNNTPGRVLTLTLTLLVGWPSYLAFNASGRPYDGFASHYNPNAQIFNLRERFWVHVSNIGILAIYYILYRLATTKGLPWLLSIYGVPVLILNAFVVLITFLQHSHPALPHYNSDEWDWLRGALATVDRDYGFLNEVFHDITDTHVIHHLFPTMPHYNAKEATVSIRPILKDYYKFDRTPIWRALWREAKECLYVEADGTGSKGVLWFKSKF